MGIGKQATVLLADDHPIFRTGLRQIIEERPDFRVVAEVGDGQAAIAQIEILNPEYAVFDLSMPVLDGFQALEALGDRGLTTKVLVVSMHAEAGYAKRARELGAIGFVAKEDAPTEVVRAFEEVENGFFMSQSVGRQATGQTHHFDTPDDDDDAIDLTAITSTERKVLILLSLGKTSKEIARDLGISPRTVQAHRRNIAEKLGITGPNRLLEVAVRHRAQLMDEQ